MKYSITIIIVLACSISCAAQASIPAGTVYPLREKSTAAAYPEGCIQGPDGQRTLYNISEPTLEYFAPENPTGAAMLIAPGGGFQILSYDGEGTMVARKLCERGIAAFVLKYRTRPMLDEKGQALEGLGPILKSFAAEAERAKIAFERENPGKTPGTYDLAVGVNQVENAFADADAAMAWIRAHSKEFGVKRLGMMGFSAGAILTLNQVLEHSKETRPDFAGVIYGGWNASFAAPSDGMPLFLCSPAKDVFAPEDNLIVYKAWLEKGYPVENHFYHDCQHGFGANETGKSVDGWIDAMFHFMKDIKFVK